MRRSKDIRADMDSLQVQISHLDMQIAVIEGRTQREITLRLGDHLINISKNNSNTGWRTVVRFEYRDVARYIRNGLADDRRQMLARMRDLQLEMAKALRAEADQLMDMADKIAGGAQ